MSQEPIHQPNDKLLKATFANPQNAAAFFEKHLPAPLPQAIDWKTLRLEPGSFISPEFRTSESDLLFRVRIRQSEAFLYLLFEHQSREDPRMALRLLSYITRIWERFAAENPAPAKLPAVLPFVLAQGKKPWESSPRLEDLIDLPTETADILRHRQPSLSYHLLELVRLRYEDLEGTAEGILTLRALKAEPVADLFTDFIWDEKLLFSLSDTALDRIIRYILNADSNVPRLEERIARMLSKPLQERTMTIAEQLKQQGRQEGRQEGQLNAFRKAVLRALEIRHGIQHPKVGEALDLIEDPERLESLLEDALRSASVEDFLQHL